MIVKLNIAWNKRLALRAEGYKLRAEGYKLYAEGYKLRAEGYKLYAEGDKLYAEGNKLYAEGNKLYAEGDKLRAEGSKLYAEGDKLFAECVLQVHGNIIMSWTYRGDVVDCTLGTGEVFRGDQTYPEDIAPCDGKLVEIDGRKYKLIGI